VRFSSVLLISLRPCIITRGTGSSHGAEDPTLYNVARAAPLKMRAMQPSHRRVTQQDPTQE
jgi:hypothetical protein